MIWTCFTSGRAIYSPVRLSMNEGVTMKIVLIDSGIDQILRSSGVTLGRNFLKKNETALDDQGHGTLCARNVQGQ